MPSIETVTSICNKALIRIDAPTISDITEDSKSAVKCNEFYAYCRDKVLQDHPWNFADTRAILAADAVAPVYGYSYKFALPSDCLMVLEVVDVSGINQDYEIECDYLFCDTAVPYIKYTARIIDTTKFSQGFIDCLILSLAENLAYAVSGSDTKVERLNIAYERELLRAKKKNGQENSTKIIGIKSSWKNSRRS